MVSKLLMEEAEHASIIMSMVDQATNVSFLACAAEEEDSLLGSQPGTPTRQQ